MEISSINTASALNNENEKTENPSVKNESGIDSFTTVQYTSKKDGKTYLAKKLTLTQGGKEVTGVYVFDKNAKPDKAGNILGEFMNYDTFIQKMADELPTVNSDTIKSYNSNIKTSSAEEKFDREFESGVKLSDGSVLIQEHLKNTGSTQIKPSKEDGKYDVIFTSFVGGYAHEPKIKTISEEDLVNDKGLCRGTVKKLDDNSYEVTYYTESNFKDHETKTEIMDKESCMKFFSGYRS